MRLTSRLKTTHMLATAIHCLWQKTFADNPFCNLTWSPSRIATGIYFVSFCMNIVF